MGNTAKGTESRDVIGFLKGQHEQIKGLFERVLAAAGQERAAAFSRLKDLMSAHEAAEEEIVHPAAERALPGGPTEVAARVKEEIEAKTALATLQKLDVSSDEFETKFRMLQKAVLAHAKSEEKEEFDKLADKLDDKQLKEMRQAVQAVEAEAVARAGSATPRGAGAPNGSGAGRMQHAPHGKE
jgi:hemerythrin superfamily protein